MATYSLPKFYCQLEIDAARRNIRFDEGAGWLVAQVPVGTYWPDVLATAIKTALDAAGTLTYTVTIADATGLVTIAATGPFQLDLSSGMSALLVGGTNKDDGVTVIPSGEAGWFDFGWVVDAATGMSTSHTSPNPHGGGYYSPEPPQKWTPRQYESVVGEARAANGTRVVADYSGRANSPYDGHPVEQIGWTFQFQSAADQLRYTRHVWPLWKTGRTVRCFDDRTAVAYQDCTLSPEHKRAPQMPRQQAGYEWYSLELAFFAEV